MNGASPKNKKYVLICTQERPPDHPKGCCKQRGGVGLFMKLRDAISERELGEVVRAVGTTCLGPCETGATVAVFPDNVWYAGVKEADVLEILESHILRNQPVQRLMPKEDPTRLL